MSTTGTKVLRALQPDLYRANAFRVSELHVEASSVDFRRRLEKLQIMEKLGMRPESANHCMALVPSPSAEEIRAVIERLADPEHRILEEFFWLWPLEQGTASQDRALNTLQQGDLESALLIWQHRCVDNTDEVAIHNLAVLYHARALDAEATATSEADEMWEKAWKYWRLLKEHLPFWKRLERRIEVLDDPRLNPIFASRVQNDFLALLCALNVQLAYEAASNSDISALDRHLALVRASGLDHAHRIRLIEAALQPVRDSLKSFSTDADIKARENPSGSDKVIRKYLGDVRPLLNTVSALLPNGNTIRDGCYDQVATTVRGLVVGFGNSTKNWRACREILVECKEIAVSASAVSLIDEDLKTVDGNIEAAACWYCKDREPNSKSVARVAMHGEISSEYQGYGTHYRWRKHIVEIPRCSRCLLVHVLRRLSVGVVLGAIPAFIFWSEDPVFVALASSIPW